MRAALWGKTAHDQRERLRSYLKTHWEIHSAPDISDKEVRTSLPEADAFVGIGFTRQLGTWARKLKLVQGIGAGTDMFDLEALPAGCVLCNVYEHEAPIAEYVFAAMLEWTLRLNEVDQELRQGVWGRSGRVDGKPHEEISGRTLGLIGYGHIGRAVASRAKAFGMRVVAVRGSHVRRGNGDGFVEWIGGPQDLNALVTDSDYVVICCPLTEQTRGMIDADRIARMHKNTFLINVARAEIVDEKAIFQALQSRGIAGAALDVWYRYPPEGKTRGPVGHYPFETLDNVMMTPHFSAWTHEMIERRWRRIAENLDRLARDEPLLNVVAVGRDGDQVSHDAS